MDQSLSEGEKGDYVYRRMSGVCMFWTKVFLGYPVWEVPCPPASRGTGRQGRGWMFRLSDLFSILFCRNMNGLYDISTPFPSRALTFHLNSLTIDMRIRSLETFRCFSYAALSYNLSEMDLDRNCFSLFPVNIQPVSAFFKFAYIHQIQIHSQNNSPSCLTFPLATPDITAATLLPLYQSSRIYKVNSSLNSILALETLLRQHERKIVRLTNDAA